MENVPFLPKTLGIKKYRQQMTSKLPANEKSRQLDADGGKELSYKFMKARYKHEHMERNC